MSEEGVNLQCLPTIADEIRLLKESLLHFNADPSHLEIASRIAAGFCGSDIVVENLLNETRGPATRDEVRNAIISETRRITCELIRQHNESKPGEG